MKPQYRIEPLLTDKPSATIGAFPKRSMVPKRKKKAAKR